MAGEKILIVEDERTILKVLKYNLEKTGYSVSAAQDGESALATFRKEQPDLVILDIMLPKQDGFEVLKFLRRDSKVPVLMLTAKKEEMDRVLGFELGADDYVTKPFSVRELLGRVKAILRRLSDKGDDKSIVRAGSLEVDLERYEVKIKGKPASLSPKEFAFIKCLIQADGKALTRDQLLERVWGYDKSMEIDTNTIDQHIARLRDRLGPEAGRIVTVKNVGYRIKLD